MKACLIVFNFTYLIESREGRKEGRKEGNKQRGQLTGTLNHNRRMIFYLRISRTEKKLAN